MDLAWKTGSTILALSAKLAEIRVSSELILTQETTMTAKARIDKKLIARMDRSIESGLDIRELKDILGDNDIDTKREQDVIGKKRPLNARIFLSCLPFDLYNFIRYGVGAPKRYETIYIDPMIVTKTTKNILDSEGFSGKVMGGDWDLKTRPISDLGKMNLVKNKILKGISWEEAGLFEKSLKDVEAEERTSRCLSLKLRYRLLDLLIEDLRSGGRLLSTHELNGGFRNRRGINMNIARDGEPIFPGGNGNHRLAIAQALKLKWIPAKACLVHPEALKNGTYQQLTKRPAYPPA